MESWNKFLSEKNFIIAWRRINTGSNAYYKRFYRDVYWAYEIALEDNIKDLLKRIKGGAYKPSPPDKVYIPKPSGLQRPVTLLTIEDQLVWQALVNILEVKWAAKRSKYEKKIVFSNLSNKDKNFFFQHWKVAYKSFLNEIGSVYKSKNTWVVHFDLAAYFDTISHSHIIKLISPRNEHSEIARFVNEILKCWTAESSTKTINHGIPQGPIASSYIGELVFLDIDKAMASEKRFRYVRYVDDIRILAPDENSVRGGIVRLEQLCRNKGLIPQSQKMALFEAKTEEEAIGKSFSLTRDEESEEKLSQCLDESIDWAGLQIKNNAKFRFFLYRSPANPKHLPFILSLFTKFHHLSDDFVTYLSRYENNDILINYLTDLLQQKYFPYPYVEGNIWLLLSNVDPERKSKKLAIKARSRILAKNTSFYLRYGLLMYLAPFVKSSGRRILNRYLFERSSVLQALILPNVSIGFIKQHYLEFLNRCFLRTDPDAGLVAAQRMAIDGISEKEVSLIIKKGSGSVRNCLVYLGFGSAKKIRRATPFQEILSKKFGVEIIDWKPYLKKEYNHAHQIFILAEKGYYVNSSQWLCCIDSFNEILTRSLIDSDVGIAQIINKDGKKKKYGHLLDPNNVFSKKYPLISNNLRLVHKRRCSVPEAHPYDEKTSARAKPLKAGERNNLAGRLKIAYYEINEAFKKLPAV